ncbi:MAG: murein L,D-transpeptidase family protein [Hyphomonas sp.]|uniref:L,D-transpeptidase family protein n=1 Tax=Hyphomonas sp. TaxID=87 RepID=UPI003527FB55
MKYRRRSSSPWKLTAVAGAALAFMCLPAVLAVAGVNDVPSSQRSRAAIARQVPALTETLAEEGLTLGAPVYLRLTKEPAVMTAYVRNADGVYEAFRSWPVCSFSGKLGPKQAEGDLQAPEGFYAVAPGQMNPSSSFHLSFDLGYPNAFDRAQGRTGSYLMVHGDCVSIGCYAMTDEAIEEIWTLMEAAFAQGQTSVPVHIFPFPMTAANLQKHAGDPNAPFWRTLAPAWQAFEDTSEVPAVRVADGAYQLGGAQ